MHGTGVGKDTRRHSIRSVTSRVATPVAIVTDNRVAREALAQMLERLPNLQVVATSVADPLRVPEPGGGRRSCSSTPSWKTVFA